MTSSGKIRIYELSKDLGLENKDVLDAAKKLAIPAKSHSSSISDEEAKRITGLIKTNKNSTQPSKPEPGKQILSLKKAVNSSSQEQNVAPKKPQSKSPARPKAPQKPTIQSHPISSSKTSENNKKAPHNSAAKPSKPPELVKTASTKPPINRPIPPASNKPAAIKPPAPVRPKALNKTINRVQSPSAPKKSSATSNGLPADRPRTISKPPAPRQQTNDPRNATSAKPPTQDRSRPKPELVGKPQPRRPAAPPIRQEIQRSDNRRAPISPRPAGRPNQLTNRGTASIKQGGPSKPGQNRPGQNRPGQNRQGQNRPGQNRPGQNRQGQPRSGPNSLELVGKPIRRGDRPSPGGNNRTGTPPRPGIPSGMRKPMAPGELMQLQKPTGRPGVPPPRRADGTPVEAKKGATPPANRPTPATAPKRPSHRAGTGAPRKPGRPDWDDSAKLEALRSKSPQKQRQKVHIIGENDDALTAETGGFAGEQQAVLLSASLARPAKPKSQQKTAAKPVGAMRKRKKETTRQRQRRRAMELRAAREAKQVRPEMLIVPEDNLSVQELADMLSVESSEIIKSLFFKGIIATVTQSLDLATIETVAEEFGVPVLQDDVEEAAKKTVEMIEDEDLAHLIKRPPVVTVMGHVDHGKTSLLDAIRKARVASGEAGGITQHIGAYQVEIEHANEQRKITFLDTPGHEAFTAMRARGTKVTDVAILVVAADDGVRPQTLEAISHARAAQVPIIVAINKIDKEGASPDRVKQELSEQELVAEEWGGDVVMVPVSAIKGENINKLLEMILLVTEVEDLQANPNRLAKGTVIEAHLDKAKGPVATLLIQNGTLKAGDVVAAGPVLGKVRAMVDENGARLKEGGPSCPVEALGFNEVPTAGDEFEVYPDEKSARSVVGERASDARATRLAQQMASRRVSLSAMSGQASEGELKELNIILKADVQGSVEAILGSLEQLPKDEVQVRVLLSAPGEITETDVDLAAASGAVIVGFNTSMASGAKRAADSTGVDVREYEVIYKLLEDIQLAMEGLLEPEMVEETLGQAEVRAIFTIGKSAVAGCYITNGKLQRNCRVKVRRSTQIVFEGDLDSLRRNKDDVKEVATGFECGIGCDRFANWQEGDLIEGYKLVTQRRKLTN